MQLKRILFVHLLNNYTGSPKVLYNELKSLGKNKTYEISLLTSRTDGILSNIEGVRYYYNYYKWSNKKIFLAFLFILSQIKSFFFVLIHKYDIIYVNTVLPFGAALAAKIKGCRIIYHVHEIYIKPSLIKRFYYIVMRNCAHKIICVSKYVEENLPFSDLNTCVIYNPVVLHDMPINVEEYLRQKFENKIIFMPTSLKEYKGVNQFVEIARKIPEYSFKLLCSVPLEEMQRYFSKVDLPKNLTLIGKKSDLWEFYREAGVLINLSLQDKFIETFGLTITEGFDAFVPAIAPNFGGPKEIIENEKNGFLINPYDINAVVNSIYNILNNFSTYKKYAVYARHSIEKYELNIFIKKIESELESLCD